MRTLYPQPKPTRRQKKPPKRLKRSRMVRKRARRIDRETELEKRYKAWVHAPERRCAAGDDFSHWCERPLQQAHFRDHTGASLKEDNLQSIPLCRRMHDAYDGRSREHFIGWDRDDKKAWFMGRLIETHVAYQLETGEALLPSVES